MRSNKIIILVKAYFQVGSEKKINKRLNNVQNDYR